MRHARVWLQKHGELVLSGGLFLTCIYAAVFFIVGGAYGAAMYASLLAFGFFVSLMAFVDTARAQRFMRGDERAENTDR